MNIRSLLFSVLFLSISSYLFCQESLVEKNYEGKDYYMLKHAWKAQWITHPTASTLDYGVFLFRKNFEIEEVPEHLIIHLSADNRYRLYVNNQYVTYGPSLGDIDHYRYETVDIADFLIPGMNVISVEVVNFGEYRRAAQQTFQTAFILQAEQEVFPGLDLNTGSAAWKVYHDKAYSCIPFTSDSLRAYYAAGPGEEINAILHPWGWKEPFFNDSEWVDPKAGTVEFAVGRGFLYGSTWFLVPREIPFMKEELRRFESVIRPDQMIGIDGFIKENTVTTVPPNTRISILIDNSEHTTGFPELIISKGKGSTIKITYAEALFRPASSDIPESKQYPLDLKGDRNNTEGKYLFGYYDRIFPDGGMKRVFRPLSRKTFRFVQFDIETAGEELILEDYYTIYTAYPFEERASFLTNDPILKEIWDVGWRTTMNSCEEHYFDPYYEQLQYIGDTRIEALVSIYVSGDDRLMRKAIKQFDDSRLPNGLTQSRYPSYIVQVIPPYSLLWVNMIHDYFMYRDDPEFVSRFFPGIKTVLDWFGDRVDSTGMLKGMEWWNFTDWSEGFANGIPPGADDGYSANIALQYVIALQNAIEMFAYFGKESEVEKYKEIERTVRESVSDRCWNEDRGLIAETPEQNVFSQHTNIWGILSNTVAQEVHSEVMTRIMTEEDLIQSTIYFKFYLFRALQKSGMGNHYLEMLDPWKDMLEKGMTTFGEKDIAPRSECHGWSASPCFDFLHTVAGIYPGSPGYNDVIIAPNPGYLEALEVAFPHPKGMVEMKLNFSKNGGPKGKILLPDGLEGEFRWQGNVMRLSQGLNEIK
ncbi:amylo-alpha-1,6-glucosidase [Bacteroidota bacterium]